MSLFFVPVLIFFARVCDVTLATLRIIFIIRGKKYVATLLGFVEILIWLAAISQVVKHMDHWFNFIAYAGGFAMGSFIGITIEEKLAFGHLLVRVITQKEAGGLIQSIQEAGFGVTTIDGRGSSGPVKIINTVIPRKRLPEIAGLINRFDPKSFYSVEDIREAKAGVFPRRAKFLIPTGIK